MSKVRNGGSTVRCFVNRFAVIVRASASYSKSPPTRSNTNTYTLLSVVVLLALYCSVRLEFAFRSPGSDAWTLRMTEEILSVTSRLFFVAVVALRLFVHPALAPVLGVASAGQRRRMQEQECKIRFAFGAPSFPSLYERPAPRGTGATRLRPVLHTVEDARDFNRPFRYLIDHNVRAEGQTPAPDVRSCGCWLGQCGENPSAWRIPS